MGMEWFLVFGIRYSTELNSAEQGFGNIRFSKESWLNSRVREQLYEPRSIKTKQKTSPEVAEMDPRAAINGYGDLVNLII